MTSGWMVFYGRQEGEEKHSTAYLRLYTAYLKWIPVYSSGFCWPDFCSNKKRFLSFTLGRSIYNLHVSYRICLVLVLDSLVTATLYCSCYYDSGFTKPNFQERGSSANITICYNFSNWNFWTDKH